MNKEDVSEEDFKQILTDAYMYRSMKRWGMIEESETEDFIRVASVCHKGTVSGLIKSYIPHIISSFQVNSKS